jgi:hypothetical protein
LSSSSCKLMYMFTVMWCRCEVQGSIICVLTTDLEILTYWRYANITVWYFCFVSYVPRRYAILFSSAYLTFFLYHLTCPSPSYSRP